MSLQRSCPMRKARAFDAAKYRNNPKMIAKYLNHALAKGDGILIAQAIGDMIRAQGVTRVSQKIGLRRESLYRSFRGHSGPRPLPATASNVQRDFSELSPRINRHLLGAPWGTVFSTSSAAGERRIWPGEFRRRCSP